MRIATITYDEFAQINFYSMREKLTIHDEKNVIPILKQ
jgi:hypothetical protein